LQQQLPIEQILSQVLPTPLSPEEIHIYKNLLNLLQANNSITQNF